MLDVLVTISLCLQTKNRIIKTEQLLYLYTDMCCVFYELQNKLGGTSITITRRVQIYSKNSGHHIRVNGTRLDGEGEDGETGGKFALRIYIFSRG